MRTTWLLLDYMLTLAEWSAIRYHRSTYFSLMIMRSMSCHGCRINCESNHLILKSLECTSIALELSMSDHIHLRPFIPRLYCSKSEAVQHDHEGLGMGARFMAESHAHSPADIKQTQPPYYYFHTFACIILYLPMLFSTALSLLIL